MKPNGIPDTGAATGPGKGFLYAARLTPEKGLELVLDAWQRHEDGTLGPLRIIGDGPLRPLAEAAAANRSDISYLGVLPNAEVRAQIGAAACVIAASTWHDVLPTIVLEALCAGRPVLVTDRGGLPFLAGDAGWVVEPDPAALAEGLAKAHGGAAGLAGAARRRFEEHFSPDVLIAAVDRRLPQRPAMTTRAGWAVAGIVAVGLLAGAVELVVDDSYRDAVLALLAGLLAGAVGVLTASLAPAADRRGLVLGGVFADRAC